MSFPQMEGVSFGHGQSLGSFCYTSSSFVLVLLPFIFGKFKSACTIEMTRSSLSVLMGFFPPLTLDGHLRLFFLNSHKISGDLFPLSVISSHYLFRFDIRHGQGTYTE